MSDIEITLTRTRRAWYTHAAVIGEAERERLYGREEIGLHCYEKDENGERGDPIEGEAYLRWFYLGGKPSPHFQVFDDSWNLLEHLGPVLTKVKAKLGEDLDPDKFEEELKNLGVVDATQMEPSEGQTRDVFHQRLAEYEARSSKPRTPGM